ncbi:MAG: cytoplasmic protein [Verrucomicrobia bacterium]|nr:cytoplasmic protein [Verrucomicrobiota bacterium]
MADDAKQHLISEPLTPAAGTGDTAMMARGEPGLPERFSWRGIEYRVVEVVRTWKTTSQCTSGADEQYVRRHWWAVRTDPPMTMTVYCDRQPKDRSRPKARWWVYTVQSGEASQG